MTLLEIVEWGNQGRGRIVVTYPSLGVCRGFLRAGNVAEDSVEHISHVYVLQSNLTGKQ